MNKIEVTHEVDDTFLADILITAVEGGITYWSSVVAYTHTEGPEHTRAEIAVDDEETDDAKRYRTVNLAVILDGVTKLLNRRAVNRRLLGYLRDAVSGNDAGHVDSDLADNIVQMGLFDEVRYG